MYRGYLLLILTIAVIGGCATSGAIPDISDPNASMVIIGVQNLRMDPDGHVYPEGQSVYGLSLKNMKTGDLYPINLTFNRAIAVLPAGIYCVNSFKPYVNLEYPYCGQPLFELKPGVISNAGYFTFAIDFRDGRYKLYESSKGGNSLFDDLSDTQLSALQRFKDAHPSTSRQP